MRYLCANDKRPSDQRFGTRQMYAACNTVFNCYPDSVEVIHLKSNFFVKRKGFEDSEQKKVDRSRKFRINCDGVLEPKSGLFLTSKLIKNLKRSHKRAIDNCYSYLLANRWDYFCTFTFNKDVIDRDDDDECIYAWSKFRQVLQYRFPDIKIILIPERHKAGQVHFHGLISNADLSDLLVEAVNPHTKEIIKTSFGDVVYNMPLFKYGFTTIVPIRSDSNFERVCNYITKYVTKSGSFGYNRKSFYHTTTLERRSRIVAFTDYSKLLSYLTYTPDSLAILDVNLRRGVTLKKNSDKLIIFKIDPRYFNIYSQNDSFANK